MTPTSFLACSNRNLTTFILGSPVRVKPGSVTKYDAFVRGRQGNLLADQAGPLPTADELGAELERFLAERSKDNDN